MQAMGPPQPIVPMGSRYVECITHGAIRLGMTTLFATLDVSRGSVLTSASRGIGTRSFWPSYATSKSMYSVTRVRLIVDNH